eukprot:PhM_4_TR16701/c0_g1_i1/m.87130/K07588/argK; LAO/AO transport system kinase
MNLLPDLLKGNHRALSKAITLIESTLPQHRDEAFALLKAIGPYTNKSTTRRIGITGAPGAGKSTFLNALGTHIFKSSPQRPPNMTFLPIDPSSILTGGSILGDKTRMSDILDVGGHHVYIRPSPSRGSLGGVSSTTEDVVLLCEAAGYNTIFVETVGVGQSEAAVRNVCDIVVLLVPPAAGDALQGMKRGLVDVVDYVVVTKFDGDTKDLAQDCYHQFRGALRLIGRKCYLVSSVNGTHLPELWQTICDHPIDYDKRQAQRLNHYERCLKEELSLILKARAADSYGHDMLVKLEDEVRIGAVPPRYAAHVIASAFDVAK